jgi:hypothetical protein
MPSKKELRLCLCGCEQTFRPKDLKGRPPQRYKTKDCYIVHRKSSAARFFPASFYQNRATWEKQRLEAALGALVDETIRNGKFTRSTLLTLVRKGYMKGRNATRQEHDRYKRGTRCAA